MEHMGHAQPGKMFSLKLFKTATGVKLNCAIDVIDPNYETTVRRLLLPF